MNYKKQPSATIHKVDSIYPAAALCAAGIPLVGLDTSNPRRVIFQFDDPRTPECLEKYHQDKLEVGARALFYRYHDLRAALRTIGVANGKQS